MTALCPRSLLLVGLLFLGAPLAGATVAAKPDAAAPEDKSLSVEEYRKLGLPSLDSKWGGAEMNQAFKSLSTLAQKDPSQLPRYQSKPSGEVFARLTATDNLASFRNPKIPIGTRLRQALTYYNGQNQIFLLYLNGYSKKVTGTDEVIELMGALSHSSLMVFEVTEEFLPTISKDDPTYKNRMAGVAVMKNGLGTFIQGLLQTLTEKGVYSVAERRRLIGHAKETLPELWSRMTPGGQLDRLKKLEEMIEDDDLKDIRPELKELLAAIKKAEKKEAKP